MKSIAFFAVFAAAVVSLSGCGHKDSASPQTTEAQPSAEQFMKGTPVDETGKGMAIGGVGSASGTKK